MAEKKFSDLTAKAATIADTDLVAISESAGGGTYTSKSVTGANIKALVTDANMTTTDITTNDVSTSKHGFAPKAPNDTTKFLRGDATWAVVPAGGLTKFTEAEATTSPNNTVYVDSLTAAGSTTNVDIAIRPKGTGAFTLAIPDNTATGGNKRGANAVDLQSLRAAATQVASGTGSVTLGFSNTASNTGSVTLGQSNSVTAANGTAIGYNNSNDGITGCTAIGWSNTITSGASYGAFTVGQQNSVSGQGFAIGVQNSVSNGCALGITNTASDGIALGTSNTVNAAASTAIGKQASVFSIKGRLAHSANQIGVLGDSQASKFIIQRRTTDATATTLISDSVASPTPFTTNQVILSNQSAYRFKGTIIGKQSGSTNASAWDVDGLIVRGANAAATTLLISNVTLVQNTPAWGTPTLAADTTNGGLRVQVTGATATNIQWTAVIETTEVIYA